MVDASWFLFILTSLLLIATPGQDMLLVMSRSVTHGAKSGMVTAAGVSIGLVGHTVLATLGLGAILRTSELLFVVLKLIGAAYLIYLAIGLLRTRVTEMLVNASPNRSPGRMFIDGALSNISNPKIAIFYFAFLPQFVSPGASHPTLTILALGILFAALTFAVKGPIALFAGLLSNWLRSRPKVSLWLHRSSGAILLALGLKLAFENRNS
jgi:threonine/homoserine/homoserine lactone efflux protein